MSTTSVYLQARRLRVRRKLGRELLLGRELVRIER
jgi:hypothetical protein